MYCGGDRRGKRNGGGGYGDNTIRDIYSCNSDGGGIGEWGVVWGVRGGRKDDEVAMDAIKTLDEAWVGWREGLGEIYRSGGTDTEARAEIRRHGPKCAVGTWYKWMEQEGFREFIEEMRVEAQAWWERHGREHLEDKSWNSTLWYMNMKNRYGWTDRQLLGGMDGGAIKIEISKEDEKL